jgi:hypothetical protein
MIAWSRGVAVSLKLELGGRLGAVVMDGELPRREDVSLIFA